MCSLMLHSACRDGGLGEVMQCLYFSCDWYTANAPTKLHTPVVASIVRFSFSVEFIEFLHIRQHDGSAGLHLSRTFKEQVKETLLSNSKLLELKSSKSPEITKLTN